MKKLVILEYFTSQSNIEKRQNQKIFEEALNITNSIIKNFVKSDRIKNIIVLRNKNLRTQKLEKVKYYFTSINVSFIDILNKLDADHEVILVAPETSKIHIDLFKITNKLFKTVGSSFDCIKIFSSKIKTIDFLNKYEIPTVKTIKDKKILLNTQFVSKPEYGAGSDNVRILKNEDKKRDKNYIFQKFYSGKKGSFLMLCKNGENRVICCNEQIIKLEKNRIYQIGCLMGGLENNRKEIEYLANQISRTFKGLFGIIGVDIILHKRKWLVLEINSRFTSSYCGIEMSYDQKTIDAITNFYLNKELENIYPKLLKKFKYIF